MKNPNQTEMDGVCFAFSGNKLEITTTADRLGATADGDEKISINLYADQTRELVDQLSNVLASEFNSRQAYRVPIRESFGLKAKIIDGQNEFDVVAKTLSMTGIFVAFPAGPKPILDTEDHFEVELQFEEKTVRLPATVKREKNEGFGLLFDDSIQNEEIDPPEELSRMVMAVQRKWINTRVT